MGHDIESAVEQIKQSGYCLIEDVLTPQECDQYKGLLNDIAREYSPLYEGAQKKSEHGLDDKSGEKVVYNLHNKSYEFFNLFNCSQVIDVVDPLLREGSYNDSEPYYLYLSTARSPNKGAKAQQLHLDCRLPGSTFPLAIIAIWMIDDFTVESGATRVVPGSHRSGGFAENGKVYDDEIFLTGKRGSVLLFDASLWHGGSTKKTSEDRWGIIVGYHRWFLKPSFDYHRNTPPEIYERMTDAEKELLGFRFNPPIDEFTRTGGIAPDFEEPEAYQLPKR